LVGLCLLPQFFYGCAPAPAPVTLLHQAQALGEGENRWTEARELIKPYVYDHPEDVAGHYLLGLSYLHVPDDYEIQGRGELLVAFRLFERLGDLGMLAETTTPDQFRMLFHQKTALTYMRSIRRLVMANVPASIIGAQMEEALRHVELGLGFEPDNHFLLEMKASLEDMLAEIQGAPQDEGPAPFPVAPIPRQGPLV